MISPESSILEYAALWEAHSWSGPSSGQSFSWLPISLFKTKTNRNNGGKRKEKKKKEKKKEKEKDKKRREERKNLAIRI